MLGTGTSVGVPVLGCDCHVCTSDNPRNKRTRCSVILGLEKGNLLIDTPADLRGQLIREGIGVVHSVLFTHEHADHIYGLDDLRLSQFYAGGPIPLHCEEVVEKKLREAFSYAFMDIKQTHVGAVPALEFKRIEPYQSFKTLDQEIIPLRLHHGPRFDVLGFRIGNVAYCTDVKEIPDETMDMLGGLDVLILGALRHTSHVTHMNIDEALEAAQKLNPKKCYFTHCADELEYEATNALLPDNYELSYDGLEIELS